MNQQFTLFSLAFARTRFYPDIRKSIRRNRDPVWAGMTLERSSQTIPNSSAGFRISRAPSIEAERDAVHVDAYGQSGFAAAAKLRDRCSRRRLVDAGLV
jgi:hypothetical protein